MTRVFAFSFLLLVAPLIPPAASANDRGVGGSIALGVVTLGSGKADSPTFYLDDRGVLYDGEWIYEEANHQDGLQRGGGIILNPVWAKLNTSDNEVCWDDSPNGPDQLIY